MRHWVRHWDFDWLQEAHGEEGLDRRQLPIVVKADVHGSVEAVCDAVARLSSDKVCAAALVTPLRQTPAMHAQPMRTLACSLTDAHGRRSGLSAGPQCDTAPAVAYPVRAAPCDRPKALPRLPTISHATRYCCMYWSSARCG